MSKAIRKCLNSFISLCLAIGFSLAASPLAQAAADDCLPGFTLVGEVCEKTYSYSDGRKTFTVPKGLGVIEIEAFGAAGGAGGLDGGACARSFGGDAGHLFIQFSDLTNKTLYFYPGGKGADGLNNRNASGGGVGGKSLLSDAFNGGRGGDTGSVGTSGGGGGGGAATVLDIDNDRYVAGGAGAGGGCAGSVWGSTPGTTEPYYTDSSTGGFGATTFFPYKDGGGGGGGGGGILGGLGGTLYKGFYQEAAGAGGSAGKNTPAGGQVAVSDYQEAADEGRVIVRYFPVLGPQALELVGSNPTSANVIQYKLTLRSKRAFDVSNIVLSGSALQALKVTITSVKPVKPPYVYNFNVTPREPTARLNGTLVATVFGLSSVPVVVDAAGPEASIRLVTSTLNQPTKVFDVVFDENVQGLSINSFKFPEGISDGCQLSALSGEGSRFQVALTRCTKGPFGLTLNQNAVTDSKGNSGPSDNIASPVYGKVIVTDDVAPEATVVLQPGSLQTNSHVYDVRFDEIVSGVSAASFTPALGTSKLCKVGYVIGSGNYYQVSLDNCTDGTFGLTLLSESIQDLAGNKGPFTDIVSTLETQSTKATKVTVIPGQLPEVLEPNLVTRIFSDLDVDTQNSIKEAGIFAPVPGAPTVEVLTDLPNSTVDEQIQLAATQPVEVGSSVRLVVNVSAEIATSSDVVAFMETDSLWQYLGRTSFIGTTANSADFSIAKLGEYKLRLVIIGKDVVTNMSLSKPAAFGKGLGSFSKAVNAEETLLSPQQIDLTLTGVAGPNGLPEVIVPEKPVEPVEPEVPVEPSPEVPGAQTDENAPSQPYDPLASPEGVKAVAEAVGTAVVIAGAVAGAAAAAAAGGGGGSSSKTGGSESDSNSQNTDSSNSEISTLDAEVETFTTAKVSWGDRIPIFRLKALTFLDTFTHDLTLRLATISPVISKVVNDGAYLRAIFGSMWLALPITGVALATVALVQPSIELRPPTWELFLAIAVLGMFDAFSGLLATLVYSIGMISIYGISDLSDIRLMLGVLLLGFGPALIGVAFRAIRKQYETSFAYLWDRLVDLAVLTFFISWSVSSMVATLPALAGRTLVVANHTAEFSLLLAIAIAIRILFEELAARGYSKRLDTINPTEVPGTSQVQKVISTLIRLFLFIFVTAAFMGNVWQVWVGSFIFILPNILGWFADRFPNYPWIWKLIPQGVPGLAMTLVVSSVSAGFISGWLEGNPEYPQYLFMLLPLPVFLIGLIGMFGREGKDDEERPIMQPKWRWVYRIGGIVMLGWTMQLAGVI